MFAVKTWITRDPTPHDDNMLSPGEPRVNCLFAESCRVHSRPRLRQPCRSRGAPIGAGYSSYPISHTTPLPGQSVHSERIVYCNSGLPRRLEPAAEGSPTVAVSITSPFRMPRKELPSTEQHGRYANAERLAAGAGAQRYAAEARRCRGAVCGSSGHPVSGADLLEPHDKASVFRAPLWLRASGCCHSCSGGHRGPPTG